MADGEQRVQQRRRARRAQPRELRREREGVPLHLAQHVVARDLADVLEEEEQRHRDRRHAVDRRRQSARGAAGESADAGGLRVAKRQVAACARSPSTRASAAPSARVGTRAAAALERRDPWGAEEGRRIARSSDAANLGSTVTRRSALACFAKASRSASRGRRSRRQVGGRRARACTVRRSDGARGACTCESDEWSISCTAHRPAIFAQSAAASRSACSSCIDDRTPRGGRREPT